MSTASKKTLLLAAMALMVAGCLALAGCSSGGQASSSSASDSASAAAPEAVEEEEQMLVIGEETDTALSIVFTNKLGADITNLGLMPAGSADAPELLMADDETFAKSEDAIVYAEPLADGALYDVVIVCGDTSYTLHDMNFELLETANIRLEGDVAYIDAVINGNAVSSLNEEYARAHPAVEEEEAASTDDETYAEEPVYYEEPTYTEQAPAQSGDACVSDVVLN